MHPLGRVVQYLLLAIIAIVPFIVRDELYFPFVSGKAYAFRALMAIAFFFWIWLLIKQKEYRPNVKNIMVVAIFTYFIAQAVAALFGVDPQYSFFGGIERHDGVLQYGVWVLYFLMFLSVFRTQEAWKRLFSVFVVAATALSVHSWLNYGTQPLLSGVFGNQAFFAGFLLFAIGFAFILLQQKYFEKRWIRIALGAAITFFIVTIIFTQVRGAYIALAGGIGLFSILTVLFLRKEYRRLAFALGVLMIVGVLSIGALFMAKETSFVQDTRILRRITELNEIFNLPSTRERVLNWSIAWKAFQERPVFGYGPENYASASNKYYDYRIGRQEPWFDRVHNQPLDVLATGGIVVFGAYLFTLGAAILLMWKIARRKRALAFLLASILFAYFIHVFFLFDMLGVYLALFPFFAFLIYEHKKIYEENEEPIKASRPQSTRDTVIVVAAGIVSALVLYMSVYVPYQANNAAIKFFSYSESGFFAQSIPFAKEAFAIDSPYTTWEVRKRAGWQLVQLLEHQISETTPSEKVEAMKELYLYITPELESFIEARPADPQVYYVLARIYRLGSIKLGFDDSEKAKETLEKGFEYSDLRVEYVNEYVQTLIIQDGIVEGEEFLREYVDRAGFFEAFPHATFGHYYFSAKNYERAFEEYEKARELGYGFEEVTPEYARYMFVAEEARDYEALKNMALAYLEEWGPEADTYFNVAVGYFYLEEKDLAREYYLKAVELEPKYKDQEAFFLE